MAIDSHCCIACASYPALSVTLTRDQIYCVSTGFAASNRFWQRLPLCPSTAIGTRSRLLKVTSTVDLFLYGCREIIVDINGCCGPSSFGWEREGVKTKKTARLRTTEAGAAESLTYFSAHPPFRPQLRCMFLTLGKSTSWCTWHESQTPYYPSPALPPPILDGQKNKTCLLFVPHAPLQTHF